MLEGHFGDYPVKVNIKEVGTKAHDNKLIYKDIIEVVWNWIERGIPRNYDQSGRLWTHSSATCPAH